MKGADKRLWNVELVRNKHTNGNVSLSLPPGVLHYAGPVVYQVKRFLEKNKDVQQDMRTCSLTSQSAMYQLLFPYILYFKKN